MVNKNHSLLDMLQDERIDGTGYNYHCSKDCTITGIGYGDPSWGFVFECGLSMGDGIGWGLGTGKGDPEGNGESMVYYFDAS